MENKKDILRTFIQKDESDTREFGLKLSDELQPGDVLALIGDLGTGKTTLTRYIAEGMGYERRVSSPTFIIVNEYRGGRIPIFHFDVYRVHDEDELVELGIDDYLNGNGVSIIEWADLIPGLLPENTKYIFIERTDKENERVYKCTF